MVAGLAEPERGALVVLDDAASWLLAVAWSHPADTSPGARLRCLSAADQLCAVGARATRAGVPPSADDVVGAVVVALAVLAALADSASAVGASSVDALAEAQDALRAVLLELI